MEESEDEESNNHDEIPQEGNSLILFADPLSNNKHEISKKSQSESKPPIEFFTKFLPENNLSKRRKLSEESLGVPESIDASSENHTETEFDIFGKYIGKQLQLLPLENALELQTQIIKLITNMRLKVIKSQKQSVNLETN